MVYLPKNAILTIMELVFTIPDRYCLGYGVDVVLLVFRFLVHGAGEGVQAAVMVCRLGWALWFGCGTDGSFHIIFLILRVIRQEVVVELGAIKLALEGPCRGGVRLGHKTVVAGRGSAVGLWRVTGAVNRRFLWEVFLRQVSALDFVFMTGRFHFGRSVWVEWWGHCVWARKSKCLLCSPRLHSFV